jgi:hypothetical protein
MRKLALDLESLNVSSFVTDVAEESDGTVRAHEDTLPSEMGCTKTTCPSQGCPTRYPYC